MIEVFWHVSTWILATPSMDRKVELSIAGERHAEGLLIRFI
jgi:hypothetical protein